MSELGENQFSVTCNGNTKIFDEKERHAQTNIYLKSMNSCSVCSDNFRKYMRIFIQLSNGEKNCRA